MHKPPKIAFVEKNSGMLIEELLLAGVDPHTARIPDILELCMHYRRVGVCRWLARADALFQELCNSAWVFTAWLANHPDDAKRTSQVAPYLDAIIAEAGRASDVITEHSRRTLHEGVEYEEDFLYARFLQSLPAGDGPLLQDLLARWQGLSGAVEPRFLICRALLQSDAEAFADGLTSLLEEELGQVRARQRSGSGDPDAAVCTDRLSLEGLALGKIATALRIPHRITHVLLPHELLMPPRRPLPGPDDWRTIENHRSLG